jgi:isoleucyl-tRNA synthetase
MPDNVRDYSETLFRPKTELPMRAGLPQKEPEILALWEKSGPYKRLRVEAAGRPKFVLHDGPPYANGNIHIGHALNKILKDVVTRSQQMLGFDSNYVRAGTVTACRSSGRSKGDYRSRASPSRPLHPPP